MNMSPDFRRAVRTWVHTLGAVSMLLMLAYIIGVTDRHQLIALGLIGILGLRELFHGAENVAARIKLSASTTGFSAESDSLGEKED